MRSDATPGDVGNDDENGVDLRIGSQRFDDGPEHRSVGIGSHINRSTYDLATDDRAEAVSRRRREGSDVETEPLAQIRGEDRRATGIGNDGNPVVYGQGLGIEHGAQIEEFLDIINAQDAALFEERSDRVIGQG